MGATLLTPGDLQGIAAKMQTAKVQEQVDHGKKEEQERKDLREAFMTRELHSEVMERVNAAVRRAAEHGLREVQMLSFPASYCTRIGRSRWKASSNGRKSFSSRS
jgi:hypothetical protein